MPLDDHAVDGADLVRKDNEDVADAHGIETNVLDAAVETGVRDRRHSTGQRVQDGRGAADGEGFERLASRQHEDDERASQVLAKHHSRDDGDASQEIGAELTP